MIGAGYTGLVSAACFADFGHTVTCVDRDAARIRRLREGHLPFFEPGLTELTAENAAAGRLIFSTGALAVAEADVVFLAVGTPGMPDGTADLADLHAAARDIAPLLTGFTVVAIKSTVPPGTGDAIEAEVRALNPNADVALVSTPEFLREGTAISDFKHPDRVVIGANDERARRVMSVAYHPLTLDEVPVIFTGRRTAELTKYAANAFLAMKVAFINEFADLCEATGTDVLDLARGIGLDHRIGQHFLKPGPGYGGSCLPKDTRAIAHFAASSASPLRLIETTVALNDARRAGLAARVARACGGTLTGKTIAVLGLTYKPNTDDMRGAPTIELIAGLEAGGARVRGYDPQGMERAQALFPNLEAAHDPYACARGADALVFATEWDLFRSLDLKRLREETRGGALIDLRNVFQGDDVVAAGFTYSPVGRGAVIPKAGRGSSAGRSGGRNHSSPR